MISIYAGSHVHQYLFFGITQYLVAAHALSSNVMEYVVKEILRMLLIYGTEKELRLLYSYTYTEFYPYKHLNSRGSNKSCPCMHALATDHEDYIV